MKKFWIGFSVGVLFTVFSFVTILELSSPPETFPGKHP